MFAFVPNPKFKPMDPVAITSDTLGLSLPIGEKAYVVNIDLNPAQGLKNCVKVPHKPEYIWCPDCDLTPWDDYINRTIDTAIQGARVTEALDRKDAEAFHTAVRHSERSCRDEQT